MKRMCNDCREMFREAMKNVFVFHGIDGVILTEIENEYWRLKEEQRKVVAKQISMLISGRKKK